MAEETKNELIEAAKNLPAPEAFSLRPRTFEEAFRFANLIASSTLIPKEFQNNAANVLVAVQLGMELGVSPMQALQNIYVVNGRPAIFGDLLPAIILASGLCEQFDEQGDEKNASCTVKRRGMAPITRTFSMVDAERAKLPERNPTYKSFPKRMLQMRARAYAMRDAFPDVLKGVWIKEDIEDLEMRDVTPAPEPIAKPQEVKADETNKETGKDIGSETAPSRGSGGNDDRQTSGNGGAESRSKHDNKAAGADKPDKKAEALAWVEQAPEAEIMDNTMLSAKLKGLSQGEQLVVCSAFNKRRNKIVEALKAAGQE